MYTILVAVDGSEPSLRAVDCAARRAKESHCGIKLLHVEKPVMAWEVGAVSSVEDAELAREFKRGEVLDASASRLDAATAVAKLAVTGEPAGTILEQAERLGADEIVIGSRGLRPLGAAMLGSVAY